MKLSMDAGNKFAAGEVIERTANAVKELAESASTRFSRTKQLLVPNQKAGKHLLSGLFLIF